MTPECIDVDFAILSNLCVSEMPKGEGISAIVHVVDGNPMAVLMEDRNILLARSLPVDKEGVVEASDTFCTELTNTVRALYSVRTGVKVDRVVLTGVELEENVRRLLEEKLDLEVHILSITDALDPDLTNGSPKDDSFWFIPIGLAARGVGRTPVGFNFSTQDQIKAVVRSSLSKIAIATSVLLILLIAGGIYYFHSLKSGMETRRDQLFGEMRQIYQETLGAKPSDKLRGRISDMFALEIKKKEDDFAALEPYLGRKTPAIEILLTVVNSAPTGDVMRLDSIQIDAKDIYIKGTSKNSEAVSDFADRLTESGFFVDSSPNMSSEADQIGFNIRAGRVDAETSSPVNRRKKQ